MDKVIDVSFATKELRQHVKVAEDCEFLATKRTHDVLSKKSLQKDKLRKASESPDASAVLYKKTF